MYKYSYDGNISEQLDVSVLIKIFSLALCPELCLGYFGFALYLVYSYDSNIFD